jgi:hypothetical protein
MGLHFKIQNAHFTSNGGSVTRIMEISVPPPWVVRPATSLAQVPLPTYWLESVYGIPQVM